MNTLDLDTVLATVRPPWSSENRPVESQAVRHDDLQKALALPPFWKDAHASVYILPDTPWAHRSSNGLNALLARLQPDRANAVLRPKGLGNYEAKIQGGTQGNPSARARRWVIDPLPVTELEHFIHAFSACRWGALRSPVFRAWQ